MAKVRPGFSGLYGSGKPPAALLAPKERVVTHAFIGKFKKLGTNQVLAALEALGKDSRWFAAQFQERYQESSNYDKIRLLRMMMDLLKQAEGSTIRVEGVEGVTTAELRQRREQLIAAIATEKEALERN